MLSPWQQMIKEDNQSELQAPLRGYFSQAVTTISRGLSQDSFVKTPFPRTVVNEQIRLVIGSCVTQENKMGALENVLSLSYGVDSLHRLDYAI